MTEQHVAMTIQSITQLRTDHHESGTRLERWVDRATAQLGRLGFLCVLTCIIGAWIGLNLALPILGRVAFDPPPFIWLTTAATFLSLYIAVLILATQRRADQLAQHREHLNLELAILSEQKTAKVIELLEESRRDNPLIRNRVDQEADAMAKPADPHSLLETIKDTHVESIKI